MSRKIAPTLTDFVGRLAYRDENERVYHAKLLAELRALLAVARAAERFGNTISITPRATCTCESCRLLIALARLRKVSGEKT